VGTTHKEFDSLKCPPVLAGNACVFALGIISSVCGLVITEKMYNEVASTVAGCGCLLCSGLRPGSSEGHHGQG
jgi:hypothetical protein